MTTQFSTFANYQIRHQATHKVGCEPGDGILNLPQGFVWACMGSHTHCIIPEGKQGGSYKVIKLPVTFANTQMHTAFLKQHSHITNYMYCF